MKYHKKHKIQLLFYSITKKRSELSLRNILNEKTTAMSNEPLRCSCTFTNVHTLTNQYTYTCTLIRTCPIDVLVV